MEPVILNNQEYLGLRDTGAEVSLVRSHCVTQDQYLKDQTFSLKGIWGPEFEVPVAEVDIVYNGVRRKWKVGVWDNIDTPFLIGNDVIKPEFKVQVVTRAQTEAKGNPLTAVEEAQADPEGNGMLGRMSVVTTITANRAQFLAEQREEETLKGLCEEDKGQYGTVVSVERPRVSCIKEEPLISKSETGKTAAEWESKEQSVLPEKTSLQEPQLAHDAPTTAHFEISQKEIVQNQIYWTAINKDTRGSKRENSFILDLADRALRLPEEIPLRENRDKTVFKVNGNDLTRQSLPKELIADLGMKEVLPLGGVSCVGTANSFPQTKELSEKNEGTPTSSVTPFPYHQHYRVAERRQPSVLSFDLLVQEGKVYSPSELVDGQQTSALLHLLLPERKEEESVAHPVIISSILELPCYVPETERQAVSRVHRAQQCLESGGAFLITNGNPLHGKKEARKCQGAAHSSSCDPAEAEYVPARSRKQREVHRKMIARKRKWLEICLRRTIAPRGMFQYHLKLSAESSVQGRRSAQRMAGAAQ
ncbi:uncharacterized protein LOC132591184 [Zootoca vivipara]|uniref:uncharacterized protein LOC132591184 n=1 Tax=Zootoca vivipara TaxID=8524 RepID=UPI00293C0B5C|nr:uncharacterized protein LOC132591184 [Zootoca vivipara]